MKLERQQEQQEMEEQDKDLRETTGNAEREGQTHVVVEVDIPRRREARTKPVTR